MKVLILGAAGMLGSALFRYLARNPDIEVWGTTRASDAATAFHPLLASRLLHGGDLTGEDAPRALLARVRADVAINCVGVVKQSPAMADKAAVIATNALLPHRLARAAAATGTRLVQISTDCVFSGRGPRRACGYSEHDAPEPVDVYGMSKLLGEIGDGTALTLRTSIVGHEATSRRGLVEWFLGSPGPVRGFANAIFSGVPAVELARAIEAHVLPFPALTGVWHLSGERIAKLDLLRLLATVYGKTTEIVPEYAVRMDRSLDGSRFRRETGYCPREWLVSLAAMRDFRVIL